MDNAVEEEVVVVVDTAAAGEGIEAKAAIRARRLGPG